MFVVPMVITAATLWLAWRWSPQPHPMGYGTLDRVERSAVAVLLALAAWAFYFAVAH